MEGRIYSPGAGHRPPLLAGRDQLLGHWRITLNAAAVDGRRSVEDALLTGSRGVGKTALLTAFVDEARDRGFVDMQFQAVRGADSVVDQIATKAIAHTADKDGSWRRARVLFERLTVGVTGFGVSAQIQPGDRGPTAAPTRDPSVLAEALAILAAAIREESHGGGVLITLDEMQVARQDDLALVAGALHRLNVEHPDAPVVFAGTGLPNTTDVLAAAGVTHPSRLFDQQPVPLTLSREDATLAIWEPAREHGVMWHPDAVREIVEASNGYPAHLQILAHATWQLAPGPREIIHRDALRGVKAGIEQIARRSLGPRWDTMPDRQMEYLAALAANGGAASVRQLETILGRDQKSFSAVRDALIREGDIYAPRRGHIHIAVPLMVPFVLSRYDDARALAEHPNQLVPLAAMNQRAQDTGLEPPKSPRNNAHSPSQ